MQKKKKDLNNRETDILYSRIEIEKLNKDVNYPITDNVIFTKIKAGFCRHRESYSILQNKNTYNNQKRIKLWEDSAYIILRCVCVCVQLQKSRPYGINGWIDRNQWNVTENPDINTD